MNWFLEDWEYPNDHIYAIERQKEIEASWQEWEEKSNKNKKPAIIKIIKNETKHQPSTVRRAHQTRT